jgi:acyl-CoA synthetase (AMP-forming)/AMP-acid ligase II
LACALLDEGLEPGDRVCMHWWNAVEPVLLSFACFKAGLIVVPVNLRLKASEAAHIFRHSGAKVCFSEPSLAAAKARAVQMSVAIYQLTNDFPREDGSLRLPCGSKDCGSPLS